MYRTRHKYNLSNPNDRAQLQCLKNAISRRRYGCFFQQRVGKSRVGVDFIGHALSTGVSRVLVLCPPSAALGWVKELGMLGDAGKTAHFQHWTAGSQRINGTRPCVLLASYDLAACNVRKLKLFEPQCIVFDEVHLLKNISVRHKLSRMLADHAEWVLGLTGTPYSNREFLDIYGIFRVIDKSIFGTSKKAFITKYAEYVDEYGNPHTWLPSAEEEILTLVSSASMRVTRKDVGILLGTNEHVVSYDLNPTERGWYNQMRDTSVVSDSPFVCISRHTWTWTLRLAQICCGVLTDTENGNGAYVTPDASRPHALVRVLSEQVKDNPVVVVIKYTADLESLRKRLSELGQPINIIRGGMSLREREWEIAKAKAFSNSVLIVQERTVAMGMDLSFAKHMVFYSWSDDAILHSQVKDRITGRFQDSPEVNYYYIVGNRTSDMQLLKHTLAHMSKAEALADWEKYRTKGRDVDESMEAS